jgi:hypothetical protein
MAAQGMPRYIANVIKKSGIIKTNCNILKEKIIVRYINIDRNKLIN